MKSFRIIMTLIFEIIIVKLATSNKTCISEPKKYLISNNETAMLFANFDSFSALLLNCNQKYNLTTHVIFNARKKIIIGQNFKFENLFNRNQYGLIKDVNFAYIKGIDIKASLINDQETRFILIGFSYSILELYLNQTLIP